MPSFLSFLDSIGTGEMMLIAAVTLMLFGSERLPTIARGIGKAMREFKKATSDVEHEFRRALDDPPPAPKTAPQAEIKPPDPTPPPTP